MTKRKLPKALVTAAVAVLGVAVAGGTAATAYAQTTTATVTTAGAHQTGVSTARASTWSSATSIPGLTYVADLTCTSSGNCVAVGSGTGSAGGSDVATERNGVWGAAQGFATGGKSAVPVAGVNEVACSSQGNCVAAGSQSSAWVASEKGGTWGKVQLISGSTVNANLSAVSCVPNGGCTAVGSLHPNPNEPELSDGMAVTESDGTWGKPRVVLEPKASSWPVFELNSVSCTARGDCTAGGYLYNGGEGGYQEDSSVLVAETNGVWGATTLVPHLPTGDLTDNNILGLSCQAPDDCTAAGQYDVTTLPSWTVVAGSFVITETGGRWQRATIIPASGGGYLVTSLSCFSIGHCVIAGDEASNADPVVADVINGRVTGKPAVLPGSTGLKISNSYTEVSCVHSGYCGVFGWYRLSDGSEEAFAATKTAAGWQSVQPVRGIPQPSAGFAGFQQAGAIFCTATGSCTAAGNYGDLNDQGDAQAFALAKPAAFATSRTLLKLSALKITYGHEQTEHLTVDVTPGVTALNGTVTIKAGDTTLAVLTLRSGKASDRLTARRLKPASYALTATYSGNAPYLGSTSASVKLKVVR